MGLPQYSAYRTKCGLPKAIKPNEGIIIRVIGGKRNSIGWENIQIPFHKLGILIDVNFLLIDAKLPTLLSLYYVWKNGLDISLQKCVITLGEREKELKMENFFLIYECLPSQLPYVLYTEGELRNIYGTFGHPSIQSRSTY